MPSQLPERALSARILVVDDEPCVQAMLTVYLAGQFEVAVAGSGVEALRMMTEFRPDLVLLDLSLGDMEGLNVCRRIKQRRGDGVSVIVVSARSTCSEQNAALAAGADDYIVKPFDGADLLSRVRTHLRLHDALVELSAARQERSSPGQQASQRTAEDRLTGTQDVAVFALAKVAESRDSDTGDHLIRMRAYAQILAEHLHRHGPYQQDVDAQFLQDLFRSSPLHDIGKVGISDAILLKPDRLSPTEYEKMKQHTLIGANILEQAVSHSSSGSFLAMAAEIARCHHERYDGSGYPAGLAGTNIPLSARIVALADVYDALTSKRPYKPPYTGDLSKQFILAERGKHFDPEIVDAFVACYDEFLQVRGGLAVQWETSHRTFAIV